LGEEFDEKIHLRVFKRNARKSKTTIENIPANLNQKKILKALKQKLSCNGSVNKEDSVILLQGDHREEIKAFLIAEGIASAEHIVTHGF